MSRRCVPPRLHRADDSRLDTFVHILWAHDTNRIDCSLLLHLNIGQAVPQLKFTRLIELVEFGEHLLARASVSLRLRCRGLLRARGLPEVVVVAEVASLRKDGEESTRRRDEGHLRWFR